MRHSIVGLKHDLNQMPKLTFLAAVLILAFTGCSGEIDREIKFSDREIKFSDREMEVLDREMEVLKRAHPALADIEIRLVDPRLKRIMVSDPFSTDIIWSEILWGMRSSVTLERYPKSGSDPMLEDIQN